MIIDLHTQVWTNLDQLGREVAARLRARRTESWDDLDGSPSSHERAMACVDGSVVIGWRSERLEAHIPNELVADFVAKSPRHRVGIAGIDPMREDATDQFDSAVGMGLSGIAVSPASQGFHPAHSDAMRIYERCLEESMPVFVLMDDPVAPSTELAFGRPVLWDEVARAFPNLRIVIGQLGHPWIDETLVLLGKHDNLYAELSGVAGRPWQLYGSLQNALSFGVMDKILFGSGYPRQTPAKAIEALYSINAFGHGTQLPTIPRAQIRGIVERDSLACLGIDAVITPRVETDAEDDAAVPAVTAVAGGVAIPGANGGASLPGQS